MNKRIIKVPGWRNGRRAGLKILFCCKNGVRVRVPPWAPLSLLALSILSQEISESSLKPVVYFFTDSIISAKGFLNNNTPHGKWTNFYENGSIKSEGYFNNGKLDSIWNFYFPNGQLSYLMSYKNGKKNGIARYYDTTGHLTVEENYINDTLSGIKKFFYPTGKISEIIPYSRGQRHGVGYQYDTSGKIITIINYVNDMVKTIEHINRTDKDGKKQGIWMDFYPNMQKKWEGRYVDDKKNGYFKYYSPKGKLERVLYYVNDTLYNPEDNSVVMPTFTQVKTNKESVLTSVTVKSTKGEITTTIIENPQKNVSHYKKTIGDLPIEEGELIEASFKNGLWKTYNENGQIIGIESFVKGKQEGKSIYFYDTGDTFQIGEFCNNLPCGEWLTFYPSKKLWKIEEYEDGILNGHYIEYSENGKIIAKGFFKNGLEDGKWILSYGDFFQEINYNKGQLHGNVIGYYPDSTIMFIEKYSMDKKNGTQKYFYKNGKISRKEQYKDGIKHGKWKYYDDDGNLFLVVIYKRDKIKSIDGVKLP